MTTVNTGSRITPMRTSGTQHIIERTYRESGAYQWVRETYVNAIEATATRIEFGVEWQAVESKGVYRRTILDNGIGMNSEQLREFFNTFGGGGKAIGGVHENFGVGSKTSLLPWNPHGVVVVSWVDGEGSMIWVQRDPKSGEYGLRIFDAEDEQGEIVRTEAVAPFADDEHGCDWAKIKPSWMGEHGTVIVLLGEAADSDTILGDPGRQEQDIKGISSYLNRRIWEVGEDREVRVHELRYSEKSKWPQNRREAFGVQASSAVDRRINNRDIRGAKHFIVYRSKNPKCGQLAASGTLLLLDGTYIDWYLWSGDRPAVQSYAAIGGYIAALYNNELYDVTSHHSTYRSFGVSESTVRKNLWLIARPPAYDDKYKVGVYPRTDRNALLIKGGPDAGSPLPLNDWAGEFADSMPEAIRSAIHAARGGATGSIEDSKWRERLADRFGSRWKIERLRHRSNGAETLNATQPGSKPRPKVRPAPQPTNRHGGGGGLAGKNNTGSGPGPLRASKTKVAGGIPSFRIAGPDDVDTGMIAAWQRNAPGYPEGVVIINGAHPVLEQEIAHWQAQYADHHAEEVRNEVLQAYGEVAVAKVAHSEFMKSHLAASRVEDELRSEAALTMALLGLIGEEAVIGPRLRAKFARKRSVA